MEGKSEGEQKSGLGQEGLRTSMGKIQIISPIASHASVAQVKN